MKETKQLFKNKIIEILNNQGTDEVLSEAALPAYAHKNKIIDYIFWKRLSLAVSFVKKNFKSRSEILDFGCGTGVLSYEIAKNGHNVTAIDLNLTPVNILKNKINYPESINFIQGDFFSLNFVDKKFDVIIALDVLEHIPLDELPLYLKKFELLLKPRGVIIISGPTENWLYKLGRFFAGNDFTGHYHETTIGKIKRICNIYFKVKLISKLIWPITLFEIFYAKKV